MYHDYAKQLEQKRVAKFAERVLLSAIVLVCLLVLAAFVGAAVSDGLFTHGSAALAKLAAPSH